jgi:hypothetical protein
MVCQDPDDRTHPVLHPVGSEEHPDPARNCRRSHRRPQEENRGRCLRVYEPSDASYRSSFFCVKKKNGSLRLVHNLQPLDKVTIRNAAVPPFLDQFVEDMAGRACYSLLDLFVGAGNARSKSFKTPHAPKNVYTSISIRVKCCVEMMAGFSSACHAVPPHAT